MPRWEDREADDLGMEDDPDDEDWGEEDDEEPTIPCPYCHQHVLEDAERCPHCEHYISREDAPPARKPWWIIIGVIACLYVVYRWNVWW
jgi:hypothetical protein